MLVYDGNTTDAQARKYGRYCGRLVRFTIYGTSSEMMVYAETDLTIAKVSATTRFSISNRSAGDLLTTAGDQILQQNQSVV